MNEVDLAAAIRTTVNDWITATKAADQQVQMSNPATLNAVLGLAVQQLLALGGCEPVEMRTRVLYASHFHLKAAFDPTSLVDTPTVVPCTLEGIHRLYSSSCKSSSV